MGATFRTVMLWGGLMVVVFLAWHFAQYQNPEPRMPFSDFLASLDADEVGSVRVELVDGGPAALFRVTFDDGQRVRVSGLYSDLVLRSLIGADVPFSVSTNDTPTWANMLISWAPFILMIGFFLFFVKVKSGSTSLDTARKAVTVRLDKDEPRVSPGALSGGAAAVVAELRDLVRAEPPATVLLTGASGSGKTHVLRALATDLGSPCLLADGASFAEIFLGVAAARVRDLFAEGRKQRVAFLALDGIDDICRGRRLDSLGERDERTQAMLQVATSLDELAGAGAGTATKGRRSRARHAFAFVGVTNRPDLVDPAVVRRFSRVVTLGPPDLEERLAILTTVLRAAGAPGDMELGAVASRTAGWERGDVRSCVEEAVRTAAGRPPSPADFEAAVAARERVRSLVRAESA